MSGDAPGAAAAPDAAAAPGLYDRGYLRLLGVVALLGVPLSLVAFGFLVAVHELEHVVWETLPYRLGYDALPAWWPVLTLAVAGVLVALAVKHLPGHGGHVPVAGLGGGVNPPNAVPGAVLAAAASLVGGAVVGPEAPLVAIGGGLALLAVRRTNAATTRAWRPSSRPRARAAAVSAIFGNPLVAAVIFVELLGLGPPADDTPRAAVSGVERDRCAALHRSGAMDRPRDRRPRHPGPRAGAPRPG